MRDSFDRSGRNDKDGGNRGVGFLVIPAAVAVVLMALAMVYPTASNWVSDAAQAEFVGTNLVPEASPVQVAQPRAVRTVKAN